MIHLGYKSYIDLFVINFFRNIYSIRRSQSPLLTGRKFVAVVLYQPLLELVGKVFDVLYLDHWSKLIVSGQY